jgi:hypothetical protein
MMAMGHFFWCDTSGVFAMEHFGTNLPVKVLFTISHCIRTQISNLSNRSGIGLFTFAEETNLTSEIGFGLGIGVYWVRMGVIWVWFGFVMVLSFVIDIFFIKWLEMSKIVLKLTSWLGWSWYHVNITEARLFLLK